MNDVLKRCLDDMENRIDAAQEERLFSEWHEYIFGRRKSGPFLPSRTPAQPAFEWPMVTFNAAAADLDAMLLEQLCENSSVLASGGGCLIDIRANYGTGILPSLFGARMFVMDDAQNTLPTTWPLDGLDEIRRVLDKGVPSLRAGLGGKCFDAAAHFQSVLRGYPKLSRYCHIYHPDLQGSMDACELLWGSRIFTDIYDHPDLVKALLELVTETYIAFMRAWEKAVPPAAADYTTHWGFLIRGHIAIRNDSAMNFSPAMYREFIQPYNQRLFAALGGGLDHFCGRGDHFIEAASEVKGYYAMAMSQPHLNDMERIFQNTIDKGILLPNLNRDGVAAAVARGKNLHLIQAKPA